MKFYNVRFKSPSTEGIDIFAVIDNENDLEQLHESVNRRYGKHARIIDFYEINKSEVRIKDLTVEDLLIIINNKI